MNFAGHAIGAGVAGIIAAGCLLFFGIQLIPALIGGAALWFGGQFPDLDIGSIPGRWFGRVGFFLSVALLSWGNYALNMFLVNIAALIGLLALFLMGIKHRGPTHKYWTPLFLIAVAFLGPIFAAYLPLKAAYLTQFLAIPFIEIYVICFALGITVHILLDGIWPWSLKGWFL